MVAMNTSRGRAERSAVTDLVMRSGNYIDRESLRRTRSVDTTERMLLIYPEDAPSPVSDESGHDFSYEESMSDDVEMTPPALETVPSPKADDAAAATEKIQDLSYQKVTPNETSPQELESRLLASTAYNSSMSPSKSEPYSQHLLSPEQHGKQFLEYNLIGETQERKRSENEAQPGEKREYGPSSREPVPPQGQEQMPESATTKGIRGIDPKTPLKAASPQHLANSRDSVTAQQHSAATTRPLKLAESSTAAASSTAGDATAAHKHAVQSQASSRGTSEKIALVRRKDKEQDATTTTGVHQPYHQTTDRERSSGAKGGLSGDGNRGKQYGTGTQKSKNRKELNTEMATREIKVLPKTPVVYIHKNINPPSGFVKVGTSNETSQIDLHKTQEPLTYPGFQSQGRIQQAVCGPMILPSNGSSFAQWPSNLQQPAAPAVTSTGIHVPHPVQGLPNGQHLNTGVTYARDCLPARQIHKRNSDAARTYERNLFETLRNDATEKAALPTGGTTRHSQSIFPSAFPKHLPAGSDQSSANSSIASGETFASTRIPLELSPSGGRNHHTYLYATASNSAANVDASRETKVRLPRSNANRAFFVGTTKESLIGKHYGTSAYVWAVLRKDRVFFVPRAPSLNMGTGIWDGYDQANPNFESVSFRNIELAAHVADMDEDRLRELCKMILSITSKHNIDLFKFN